MGCASKHEGVVDLWMISGLILDDLEYEGSIQWAGYQKDGRSLLMQMELRSRARMTIKDA